MDFDKLGRDILANVGGPENVAGVTHCVTRVRFTLKDQSKANDAAIENMTGVLQLVKQGGQYQVVIGPSVEKVYDAVLKYGKFGSDVTGSGQAEPVKAEGNWFNRALGLVSGIFAPILGLLCGAGMIAACLSVLTVTHVLSTTSGTYIILNALAQSVFYFFPVIIGWSAAKKFGMPGTYGMVIGGAMIYPDIVAAASATHMKTIFAGTIFALKYKYTFLGVPIALQSYASSVVPAIVVMWIGSYFYKYFKKHIPDLLKTVFVPFLTILFAGVVGLLLVGPVAMILQNMLSDTVLWLISISKGITGFLLGAFWSILVMFGLHWAVIPFFAIDVAKYGYDVINPLIFSGAMAVLGSAIGVAIKTKDADTRSMSIAAAISSFFGVSEPALYGVLVPRKWIMITSFAGAGIGGAIAGFGGAKLYSFGANGILGLPCFINPKGIDGGFISLCLSGVVAFLFALICALVIGDKKESTGAIEAKAEEKQKKVPKELTLTAPVAGTAIDLTEVKDEVFSKLILGDGIAIEPSDGKVYAPFDGIVRVAYPTGHAVGIATESGAEYLLHLGIDTVDLKGQYFKSHVEQGMKVKQGDLLVEYDVAKVKAAGYDPTLMLIITKNGALDSVTPLKQGPVKVGDKILDVKVK